MPMSNNGFSKLVEETGELQQVAGKKAFEAMGRRHTSLNLPR